MHPDRYHGIWRRVHAYLLLPCLSTIPGFIDNRRKTYYISPYLPAPSERGALAGAEERRSNEVSASTIRDGVFPGST